ncbi:MAG: hypothetical protein P8R48_12410 [Planctomycetota bacterium]|nr:hypothetical protein [Planctomycetota bacterium]
MPTVYLAHLEMQKKLILILAIIAALTAGLMLRTPESVEEFDGEFIPGSEPSPEIPSSDPLRRQVNDPGLQERTPIAVVEESEPPRGGIELVGESVTQRDGILYLGDFPLSQVNYDEWEMADLKEVIKQIQPFQIMEKNRVKAAMPTDHLFVTAEDYTNQSRWHDEHVILYGSKRKVVSDTGELETEYGYIEITPDLSATAFAQRDEVVRIYSAPAYSAYLLRRGAEMEREVLERCPDAVADVTSDLTHWTFFGPDGSIVGGLHLPKFGSN